MANQTLLRAICGFLGSSVAWGRVTHLVACVFQLWTAEDLVFPDVPVESRALLCRHGHHPPHPQLPQLCWNSRVADPTPGAVAELNPAVQENVQFPWEGHTPQQVIPGFQLESRIQCLGEIT